MYPDSSMPVQGTGMGAAGMGLRQIRSLALVGAGAALALSLLTPGVVAPSAAPCNTAVCSTCSFSTEQVIIQLCRDGQADQAVAVADAAISRTDDAAAAGELHFLRGGALRLLGRLDEAKTEYAQAVEMAGPTLGRDTMMDYVAQSGDSAAVGALARQSLQENADNSCAVNNACWELAIYPGGDAAMAVRLMKPIAAHSEISAWIDTYAWSLYVAGDQQAAVDQETRAIQNISFEDPDHVAYYRACVEGMKGNHVQAERELRQLFQHDILFTSAWAAADRFAGK